MSRKLYKSSNGVVPTSEEIERIQLILSLFPGTLTYKIGGENPEGNEEYLDDYSIVVWVSSEFFQYNFEEIITGESRKRNITLWDDLRDTYGGGGGFRFIYLGGEMNRFAHFYPIG